MNIHKIIIAAMAVTALSISYLKGQESEQMVVKLTDASKPGSLHVGLITGSIKVSAHTGKDVIITASMPGKTKEEPAKYVDGMRKINTNSGFEITAKQNDNKIDVKVHDVNKSVLLSILVPSRFSLKLSTINSGSITVDNVDGNHEISNVNGSINMSNIDGAVVANTINGSIHVQLNSVLANTPMAFSSLNGAVDISLPANIKANIKAKSDRGDVYSDFDIEIDKNVSKIEQKADEERGMYKIHKDNWTRGKINGGGAEIMIKTMNGSVKIRKK